MMEVQTMCGCHVCDLNCEVGVRRQRVEQVNWLICQWKIPSEERPFYRKMLHENSDLIDCIIILQRLKRIVNGTEY